MWDKFPLGTVTEKRLRFNGRPQRIFLVLLIVHILNAGPRAGVFFSAARNGGGAIILRPSYGQQVGPAKYRHPPNRYGTGP